MKALKAGTGAGYVEGPLRSRVRSVAPRLNGQLEEALRLAADPCGPASIHARLNAIEELLAEPPAPAVGELRPGPKPTPCPLCGGRGTICVDEETFTFARCEGCGGRGTAASSAHPLATMASCDSVNVP